MRMGLAIVPFAWACSSRPVKTIGNLRNAVLYERGAAERCRACAVRAQEEGCFDAARLFAALARSEEIQAEHQLRLLNGYGERMAWEALPVDSIGPIESTRINLENARRMESYKMLTAFPIFEQTAAAEGVDEAVRLFRMLTILAERHEAYFRRTLEGPGRDTAAGSWSVCARCGGLFAPETTLPERCEICEMPVSVAVEAVIPDRVP